MNDELSDQESELIEVLRHDGNVTVEIRNNGGTWHVKLTDHDAAKSGDGYGPTFERAWDEVRPRGLKVPSLTLVK